jgi:NCS1 family nucleobase:cation symporter-1
MRGYQDGVDYKIYQISFFVGYPVAVVTYIIINKFFPPEGLGISEELETPPEEQTVVEGVVVEEGSEKGVGEKQAEIIKTTPTSTLA